MRTWSIVFALTFAPPSVAAQTSPLAAVEALSTGLTWITGYLGIGALLIAVATAVAVREHRAWSELLDWNEDASRETRTEEAIGGDRAA